MAGFGFLYSVLESRIFPILWQSQEETTESALPFIHTNLSSLFGEIMTKEETQQGACPREEATGNVACGVVTFFQNAKLGCPIILSQEKERA